jgi:hypothetical protein
MTLARYQRRFRLLGGDPEEIVFLHEDRNLATGIDRGCRREGSGRRFPESCPDPQ